MLCALCTSISSYRRTEHMIAQDVNRALEQVLATMPDNVVTTDTIRCYRNNLTISELKDTAGIAMRTVRMDGRWETRLVAEANCGFATTFGMSDQRASGSILFVDTQIGKRQFLKNAVTIVGIPLLNIGRIYYHTVCFVHNLSCFNSNFIERNTSLHILGISTECRRHNNRKCNQSFHLAPNFVLVQKYTSLKRNPID